MHFCSILFTQMNFLKAFSLHFNSAFQSRNIALHHFNFAVELKKYFWRHFSFADFRSQPQNREIFIPRKIFALKYNYFSNVS